jgi:hypothetical protein
MSCRRLRPASMRASASARLRCSSSATAPSFRLLINSTSDTYTHVHQNNDRIITHDANCTLKTINNHRHSVATYFCVFIPSLSPNTVDVLAVSLFSLSQLLGVYLLRLSYTHITYCNSMPVTTTTTIVYAPVRCAGLPCRHWL